MLQDKPYEYPKPEPLKIYPLPSRHIHVSPERVLATAVSAGTLILLFRLIAGPDATRRLVMSSAKRAENCCMTQAKAWASMAESCSRVYDKSRLVTL